MKFTLLGVLALALASLSLNGQNNALNFDGIDDYIQSINDATISGGQARTIEAWIRTSANSDPNTGGLQQVIVEMGTFVIGGRFTLNLLWNNAIRVEIGGSGISGSTPVNDGQWHHVAVVYNPSISTNQVKLYLDGTLESQGNFTTGVNTTGQVPFIIGLRSDGYRYFEGDIDEVRIWSTVRTAAQISNSYQNEVCSVNNSGLELYYTFNQGIAGGNNIVNYTAFDQFGTMDGLLYGFTLSGNSSNWLSATNNITYLGSDSTISLSGCNQVVLPSNGQTVTSTGTYHDTIPNAQACDSLLTYNVTVNQLTALVNQSHGILYTNPGADTYQWFSCDSLIAPVNGATSDTLVPTQNGLYSVVITKDGCTDTSNCFLVDDVSLIEDQPLEILVYPNPSTSGDVHVSWSLRSQSIQIEVLDISGRIVHQLSVSGSVSETQLSLDPGLYYMRIRSDEAIAQEKVLIL